jgi:hypothetical protein
MIIQAKVTLLQLNLVIEAITLTTHQMRQRSNPLFNALRPELEKTLAQFKSQRRHYKKHLPK